LRDGKIRENTFSNAEIYQIGDFVHVGRPVGRVTRGEVSEVVAFQCIFWIKSIDRSNYISPFYFINCPVISYTNICMKYNMRQ
jgi:hypothetical protein